MSALTTECGHGFENCDDCWGHLRAWREAFEGCTLRGERRPVQTPEEAARWVFDVVEAGIECHHLHSGWLERAERAEARVKALREAMERAVSKGSMHTVIAALVDDDVAGGDQ